MKNGIAHKALAASSFALFLGSAGALAAPLDNVTAIVAGASHTCALRSTGVMCWGWNAFGQLGSGSTADYIAGPVAVVGLAATPVALAAGSYHTCALLPSGGVQCWGMNGWGQLGDGTTANRYTAVHVPAHTSGVIAVGAGSDVTCVVRSTGAVSCWGDRYGPLGDGGITSGAVDVKAGIGHACALMASGGVKCWGENMHGELGDGTFTPHSMPADVASLTSGISAIGIGAGMHTCALTIGGGAKCWGRNGDAQVGIPANTPGIPTPIDVQGLPGGLASIHVGRQHTCAVTTGAGYCWGANESGQRGNGGMNTLLPTPIQNLSTGVVSMALGESHSCALLESTQVVCWGRNNAGQIGIGATGANVTTPGSPVLILAPQTITFAPIPDTTLASSPLTLTATASSGLPVTYSQAIATWPGSHCGISGSTVTLIRSGVCPILAQQLGNFDYLSAPPVLRAFNIVDPAAVAVPRLANISTRVQILPGQESVAIAGFFVKGPDFKTVVIRATGPSLSSSGLTGLIANPTLALHAAGTVTPIWVNHNWRDDARAPVLEALGLAPTNDNEAALLVTLTKGLYTVVMSGEGGSTGIGSVEVFEIDRPESPLANIATRGPVLTGNDVMIAGFIIQGSSPQTVVIHASGPSLTAFGIANALANPTLALVRSSDGVIIASNDDWQVQTNPSDVAAITSSGVVPSHPLESAIIRTLPPGAYTAIVQGAGTTTGIGMVGVYAIPR